MARVLTVILNWRTPAMTLRAVEAALAALEGIDGAVVVVDNDSGDGSFERLTAEVAAQGWDAGPQQVRVLRDATSSQRALAATNITGPRTASCRQMAYLPMQQLQRDLRPPSAVLAVDHPVLRPLHQHHLHHRA